MAAPNKQDFIAQYGPEAQRIAPALGVAPEVVLAHWGQETGWGANLRDNNLGNIQAGSGYQGATTVRGDTTADGSPYQTAFRAYQTPSQAADDYASLIQRRYPDAMGAGGDALKFGQALKAGGYMANPNGPKDIASAAQGLTLTDPVVEAGSKIRQAFQVAQPPNVQKLLDSYRQQQDAPASPPPDDDMAAQGASIRAAYAKAAPSDPASADTFGPTTQDAMEMARQGQATAAARDAAKPADTQVRDFLAPDPNTTYGSLLPVAVDKATGTARLALPSSLRELALGGYEMSQGPATGTVTPLGTNALFAAVTGGGRGLTSPAAETGAAIGSRLLPQGAAGLGRNEVPDLLGQEFRNAPMMAVDRNALAPVQAGMGGPSAGMGGASAGMGSTAPAASADHGGWRPMQPGEPLLPGQAVATDAAGRQYVRDSGNAPPAAPTPNSVGAAATPAGVAPAMTPQEALAARTQGERNRFNTPPRGQDTTTYVAGTQPTLAEVAGSPEAAFQQKQVSQNPLTMDALTKQMQRNNDARVLHYEDIAGSEPELQRMVAARSAQADADLQAAFANRKPTDTTDAVKTINDILADPRVAPRDQITSPVRGILDKMTDADGNPITDPLALYGVREHITDMLSKPSMGRDPTVANARPQLVEIKNALDDAIEKGAPGFAKYRENYTNASNPIDAMQFLQQARAGLTNQAGQFQAAKYNNLMKNIVEDRATGDTTLPASKLTDDQMNALFNLHADTKRMGNIDLSNPRGSDTNMLGQAARMAGMTALHGVAGYVAPVVGNIGIQMGKTALQQRQANRLLQGVLNPDPAKYPPTPLN